MAKKYNNKYKGLEDLLLDATENMLVPDDGMDDEVVFINVEEIDASSRCDAFNMVEDLVKVYGNKAFMSEHPDYKKRIDIELENLRSLIKMKKSDEIVHDILIKAIGKNTTNASLYASLNKMQASILSIQKQMDETIKNLNGLLKNYQFELPLEETNTIESKSEKDESNGIVSRGNKEFIINQLNKIN